MRKTQRCIVLRSYPSGSPQAGDFECVERDALESATGQVLVDTLYLSMDPAPRMRMHATAKPSPMPLGEVVGGRGVGIVRKSADANFECGDVVAGELGWQEQAVVTASSLRKIDPSLGPVQTALSVLGPSGIAAWCLVHSAAAVRAGDTVVVTAAAGAVGSVALQLARLSGARVVGIVGGAAQARFVSKELAADAVVDHGSASLGADLAAACPGGVNVFLDSVGGALHNEVMQHICVRARIIAFGYISAYNAAPGEQAEYGRIYQVINRRAEMRGFLVADYASRFDEALRDLGAKLAAGSLKNFETCIDGIQNAPQAFAGLFAGNAVGKQLVRISTSHRQGDTP